jgi:hypothetical protein
MKNVLLVFVLIILFPLSGKSQLIINASLNKCDTVLHIDLANSSDKEQIVMKCWNYASYIRVFFLNDENKCITNLDYGFELNRTPKPIILISPSQSLSFVFTLASMKEHSPIRSLKKIRIEIYLKYSMNTNRTGSFMDKSFTKEFVL